MQRRTSGGPVRGMEKHLFVYGTLARGQRLHKHLTRVPGTQFIGEGKIQGELYALIGQNYPGAVLSDRKDNFVHGELYEMADAERVLELLDKVEGCDEGLFRRELVDVVANGGKKRAWTYLYAQPLQEAEIIPSGDFRRA